MAGTMVDLNDGNFAQLTRSGVALVDFWAPWCGPCRMQTPVVEKLAAAYTDKALVGKLNVDDSMRTAAAFGVSSIPTIVFLKDGREIMRAVGLQTEQKLKSALDAALK
jgi:thioredoxin 1